MSDERISEAWLDKLRAIADKPIAGEMDAVAVLSALPRLLAEVERLTAHNVHWQGAHAERGSKVAELQEEIDKWIERYRAALAERDAAVARNGANEREVTGLTASLRACGESWGASVAARDASDARYAAALEHGEQAQLAAEAAVALLKKWHEWYWEFQAIPGALEQMLAATDATLEDWRLTNG